MPRVGIVSFDATCRGVAVRFRLLSLNMVSNLFRYGRNVMSQAGIVDIKCILSCRIYTQVLDLATKVMPDRYVASMISQSS